LSFYYNRAGTGAVAYSITPLADDTWYHFFVTCTPARARLYFNGYLVHENSVNTGNITYYDQVVRIGASPTFATNGNGMKIDEWSYWTRELGKNEVQALYNLGNGKFY